MSPPRKITVILAGGKAIRYGGQDKGEVLINGKRLIDIIHARLKPQSDDIIISGTQDYGLGLTTVPDADDAPGGPVGGIYSIWKYLLRTDDEEGFFTVAVDGPNLPDDVIERLYAKARSAIAIDNTGRHPTYGWWRLCDLSEAFKDITATDSMSLNRLADLTGAKTVAWDDDSSFTNINRQSDLERFVKGA